MRIQPGCLHFADQRKSDLAVRADHFWTVKFGLSPYFDRDRISGSQNTITMVILRNPRREKFCAPRLSLRESCSRNTNGYQENSCHVLATDLSIVFPCSDTPQSHAVQSSCPIKLPARMDVSTP